MRCVVFGGSGQIGHCLLPLLRARHMPVVAVSREHHDAIDVTTTWVRGSLPDGVPQLPAAVTAIICLGPLDHFSQWLVKADIDEAPRIVAMSSMSAESKRHSPDAGERELASRLRESEQRLLQRCVELGSACTILRATLIYGGASGSLERLAARARRWRVFPLLHGKGLRQPVHAQDLAQAVLMALEGVPATATLCIGGGERLSATHMFARVRRQLAPGTLGVPIPMWILRALTVLGGRGRGMAARLGQDLVADNGELVSLLGIKPRSFQPGPTREGANRF
ncbi:MAG TPA: hypothetical protein VF269_07490 [Rhodanobacteraceae bacterium]